MWVPLCRGRPLLAGRALLGKSQTALEAGVTFRGTQKGRATCSPETEPGLAAMITPGRLEARHCGPDNPQLGLQARPHQTPRQWGRRRVVLGGQVGNGSYR